MIEIKNELYKALMSKLVDAIGEQNYFSGTICSSFNEFEWRFTASIIIYRDNDNLINKIVPVWWEFHTYVNDVKDEHLNDFSFLSLQNSFEFL